MVALTFDKRVGAGVLFVLTTVAIITGVKAGATPLTASGLGAVCPSALESVSGQTSFGQGLAEVLTNGGCTQYVQKMTGIMIAVIFLGVIFLAITIVLVNRRTPILTGFSFESAPITGETLSEPQPGIVVPAVPAPIAPAGWFPVKGQPGLEQRWDGER